jgi:hypothetical protein
VLTKGKNGSDECYYDYCVLTTLAIVGGEEKGMKHKQHDAMEVPE